jgi:hypothetical protein
MVSVMTHVLTTSATQPVGTRPGGPPAVSAATRHLSAAAYLDVDFRRRSLREVFHQAGRMVAPSHGFDLITVLGHCLRARNIALVRDGVTVAVILLAAVMSMPALAIGVSTLVTVYFVVSVWRIISDAARELRTGGSVAVNVILLRIALLGIVTVVAYLVLAAVFAAALASLLDNPTSLYGSDSNGYPSTSSLEATAGLTIVMTLLVLFALFTIPMVGELMVPFMLEVIKPGRPLAPPRPSPRFDQIHRQLAGNTIGYGDYNPFVGAGDWLRAWSIAQRLVRPPAPGDPQSTEADREFDEPPFTAVELVEHVRTQLSSLATESTHEGLLPGLTVEDRIFVSDTESMALTPYTPTEQLGHIITDPTAPQRHYLACQVVSWKGELVTTVYIHVALQGKALYLELDTLALPPCRSEYRVGSLGAAAYLRAIGRGLVYAPGIVAAAPLNLLRAAWDALLGAMSGSTYGARYTTGAVVSVRELGAADDVRSHLQLQDIAKYSKVIERRLVAAVLDFLETRGVDTGEFLERTMNVLNIGALNTGSGQVHVEGDAAGSQTKGTSAAPAPARR